MPDDLCAKVKF